MATSSLLDVDIKSLLRKAETLTGMRLPKEVVEVTLEKQLDTLCIRFKKPKDGELAEPVHPQIHVFKDAKTNEITALELIDAGELLNET